MVINASNKRLYWIHINERRNRVMGKIFNIQKNQSQMEKYNKNKTNRKQMGIWHFELKY